MKEIAQSFISQAEESNVVLFISFFFFLERNKKQKVAFLAQVVLYIQVYTRQVVIYIPNAPIGRSIPSN